MKAKAYTAAGLVYVGLLLVINEGPSFPWVNFIGLGLWLAAIRIQKGVDWNSI